MWPDFYLFRAFERQRELLRVAELCRPIAAASQAPQTADAPYRRGTPDLIKTILTAPVSSVARWAAFTIAIFATTVMAAVAVGQAVPALGRLTADVPYRPGDALIRPVIYEPWRGWCSARLGACGVQGAEPR